MNSYICARKVPLLTYESGNNKFYDCSFTLRPTFKANSKGQYKITVNEALFNNTEPFINKDDYIDFIIETDTVYTFIYRIKLKKDYYLYRQGGAEWKAVIELLNGSNKNYIETYQLQKEKNEDGTETIK